MHARATVVAADPGRVDDLIRLVRDRVVPAVDEHGGSLGLSMNVATVPADGDRSSVRCTVTDIWADRASMHASERALRPLRDAAGRLAGARPVTEEFELAVLHRLRQAEVGCWVRSTRVRLDPARVDVGLRVFRTSTLPAVERLAGFRSALLLVDRGSGNGVVSVVFDDRAALDASRGQASSVRQEESARASAQVSDVAEAEIVVAELRLPLSRATATG